MPTYTPTPPRSSLTRTALATAVAALAELAGHDDELTGPTMDAVWDVLYRLERLTPPAEPDPNHPQLWA